MRLGTLIITLLSTGWLLAGCSSSGAPEGDQSVAPMMDKAAEEAKEDANYGKEFKRGEGRPK